MDGAEVIKQLAEMIRLAKQGDEKAIAKLRSVCRRAADAAPPNDLARMAQLLHDIRSEAAAIDEGK